MADLGGAIVAARAGVVAVVARAILFLLLAPAPNFLAALIAVLTHGSTSEKSNRLIELSRLQYS